MAGNLTWPVASGEILVPEKTIRAGVEVGISLPALIEQGAVGGMRIEHWEVTIHRRAGGKAAVISESFF